MDWNVKDREPDGYLHELLLSRQLPQYGEAVSKALTRASARP
jgi:hypothetical protein